MKLGKIVTVLAAALVTLALPAWATRVPDYTHSEIRALKSDVDKGDVEAMVELGTAYNQGRLPGSDRSVRKAVEWYSKAAELGSAEAMRELGILYDFDDEVPRDEAKAHAWYLKSAERGDVWAQNNLARLYEASPDLTDYTKAYHWTYQAALQGHLGAIERLNLIYFRRSDVSGFDAFLADLERDAAAGDAEAQWRLGQLYASGHLVEKDELRAQTYYDAAAVQGHAEGLNGQAFLLIQPDSGDSAKEEAVRAQRRALWWQAAQKGHVVARRMWAADYFGGDQHDPAVEALIFSWEQAAAENGDLLAQRMLIDYYFDGLGAWKSLPDAYKWHLISRTAPFFRDLPMRNFVQLTPVERAEGEADAKAWLDAHPGPFWLPQTLRHP